MMRQKRKSKPKIITKNKSYPLSSSPFFKLKSKKKLAFLLGISFFDLKAIIKDKTHYYSEFESSNALGKTRKIQEPVKQLGLIHTRIASLICRIQQPDYVHSGRKKRSYITNAVQHLGPKNVLTTDITSFFPSTKKLYVFNFFLNRMLCEPDIADLIADICTIHDFVPTGSRISMPISYWANVAMFEELDRLCVKHDVDMTLYVDDLTFSGANVNSLFTKCVKDIINRHGHQAHKLKTKLYSAEQPKLITGVIVDGEKVKIRNRQHYGLAATFDQWKQIRDIDGAKDFKITKSLVGRLQSMAAIDPIFKQKAKLVSHYKAKA